MRKTGAARNKWAFAEANKTAAALRKDRTSPIARRPHPHHRRPIGKFRATVKADPRFLECAAFCPKPASCDGIIAKTTQISSQSFSRHNLLLKLNAV